MHCEICPLAPSSTTSLDQVFANLARCDECEFTSAGSSSRMVALLRQAGKEARKNRAEINRLRQELDDFQNGSDTDRARIEQLETLHTTAMRELENALAERDALVHEQGVAIRALSSPILEVSPGVLAVPLIGKLSAARTSEIMQDLLTAVIDRGAERVALDLTGLHELDATTAEHITSLCKAVALVGAQVVISGLRPDVVRMLIETGIDVSSVKTVRSLRQAIVGVR